MVDPATILGWLVSYFVANCMGNVVSAEITNVGHHVFGRVLRAIDGDSDERANHDIARTLRFAQLTALETSLDGYTRLKHGAWGGDQIEAFAFLDEAASFCRGERQLAKKNPEALAVPVLETLQAATDGVFAVAAAGSGARAYADTIAEFAETAVLDELRERLKRVSVAVPADFDAYLRRGAKGDHPRFLASFADEIREAVKSNPRYRDILLASGISEIKAQGFEITEILLRLERDFGIDSSGLRAAIDRIDAKLDGLTELTRQGFADLARQLAAMSAGAKNPGPEPNVAAAVESIAEGARAGDTRLATAMDLLKAGNADDAVPLLRAFAEDRRTRIAQDRRDAATAYRNLGAIAGLRDPRSALEAYAIAADLDPDDRDSLLWAGWLAKDRGELAVADSRLRRLLALTGEDEYWRFWALVGLGDVRQTQGDLAAALTSYRASLAIAERLARADPGNAGWQRDLSVSHDRIGDVQRAQGDLAAALTSYQASLVTAERLAKADPGNADWQNDLSVSYIKLGDVRRAQGDLAAALTSYQASHDIFERLAKADPGNAGWQRDISVSHNKIGDVRRALGDLAAALTSYQASLAIRERLAKADPGNAGWQRDLSVSHNKIGDVRQARGDVAAALTSYQASLATRERLAKADPGNAFWQRDLSVSHNNIGDVRQAQGDLAAAQKSYQADLAIAERLAKADPGNAFWQRDLSVSHNKIGEVQQAQGDLAAALTSYQASLAIAEPVAKADPGNAFWQRDLSVSHNKIGEVRQAQGDLAAALTSYQASLAIRERLAKADPGNADWQRDLSVSHNKIGDVRKAQGDLAAALTSYQASLAIAERLAKADPGNAGWQRDLALSFSRVAFIDSQRGARDAALGAFRRGQDIIARLIERTPENATLRNDLSWFENQIAGLEREDPSSSRGAISGRQSRIAAWFLRLGSPGRQGAARDQDRRI